MLTNQMIVSASLLMMVTIIATAVLKGWQDWLALKRRELDARRADDAAVPSSGMARIEIADLKERIRKLEAIAAGVDL